jgi:5'-nucleotidase/UDP-sugar diphosphatase
MRNRLKDCGSGFGKRMLLLGMALLMLVLALPEITAAADTKEQTKTLTILFTHDLHDNLLPFQSVSEGIVSKYGGYARLKTAIDAQREIDPEAVLVDAGDFSMGTPFQTIFETDSPGLLLLGAMGYDATTFGNHEFDYRPAGLTASLATATQSGKNHPSIVQSNLAFPVDEAGNMTETLTQLKSAMEEYGVYDYTVIERNGFRIGIFGVMGEESASMAPMSEVTFTDQVEQAKRVVKVLKEKEKVDFILCLSHSGTKADPKESEDEILAREVPEINLIVSAHTHTILKQPITVKDTVIGSAGSYGKYLGCVKMAQNTAGAWEVVQYELIPIEQSLAEDEEIAELVAEYKKSVQTNYFDAFGLEYDEVVAASSIQFQTPEELSILHGEATIGNLISDAYIYSVKKAEGETYIPVDAAIVPCGTIRDTIFKGEVTAANAFSISSLGIGADKKPGYPLISVYLTGKELKTACEVDASITPLMSEAQLYMSGLRFTFNPNRLIFNKVTQAELVREDRTAEEIDDEKLYRVVCNLYSAQMLSIVGDKSYGLISIIPKDQQGNDIIDFEKQIIYDTSGGEKNELKEWYAVVQYLQSFDAENGVAQIPAYYGATQGRKVIDPSSNIIAVLENPNRIGVAVYGIVLLLAVIIFLIIRRITGRSRRRKKRKGSGQTRGRKGTRRKTRCTS